MQSFDLLKTDATLPARILGGIVAFAGLYLAVGGLYLILLGGSFYYLIAGLALIASGFHLYKGRLTGVWIYLGVLGCTLLWALFEVGFAFWPLVPRLVAPLLMGAIVLAIAPMLKTNNGSSVSNSNHFKLASAALSFVFVIYLIGMFLPKGVVRNAIPVTPGKTSDETLAMGNNWGTYGRTGESTRYAPFDQINRSNVSNLKIAWTARTGHIADGDKFLEDQNTPLFVDGTVYQCAADSTVTAIDGVTGKINWQFDPKATSPYWKRCRTLGYFDPGPGDACGPRIVLATVDVRMISLRASDGKICETFGKQGTVDLHIGMGDVPAGYLTQTTGPFVAGDKS